MKTMKEDARFADMVFKVDEEKAFKEISNEELDTTFQTLFKIMQNINKPGDENFE